MFQRKIVEIIAARMREDDNPLIQVVAGPRQTGKSTAIAQALAERRGQRESGQARPLGER